MNNIDAINLIERAWDTGYTGQLGPRRDRYTLHVEGNTVIFSDLEEDNEEMFHLCLTCLILDREFVSAVVGGDPDEHLRQMVCMRRPEDRISYLNSRIRNEKKSSVADCLKSDVP